MVLATVAAGCGGVAVPRVPDSPSVSPPREASEREPPTRGGSDGLEHLELSAEQQKDLEAIGDRLRQRLTRADRQRVAFQDAAIDAIAHCDPAFARLHIEGQRMIRIGTEAKPAVLDALDELHELLSADQRKKLVQPMLSRSRARRGDDGSDGFEALGKELDLSVSQVLAMLKRARNHISLGSREREALRDQFEQGAKAFMGDRFHAHETALAQEPVVEHVVRFVHDLGVVVLPVLDARQCTALAKFGRDLLAEAEAKDQERATKAAVESKAPSGHLRGGD